VGYKVSKNKDKTDASGSVAVISDSQAVKDCLKIFNDKDLCKFTGNYAIDKLSYKMTLTSTSAEGNSTSIFLSDGKGNTQMTSSISNQQSEAIFVNNVSYLKDTTDGKWIKFAANDTSAPKETNPTSDIKIDTKTENSDSKVTYKKLGKEKCGNRTCLKYQVIDPAQPNATSYFWFDTKDYRMQRYYFKDDKGTSDMVITYISVKINAPSPTKDFSAGGMSQAEIEALQQQYQSAVTPTQ
jgi:hypothetical protein